MNKNKIKNFLSNSKAKIAIGVVGGIILGVAISGPSSEQIESVDKANSLTKEVSQLKEENLKLQAKVDEAKPFFQMEESKRKEEIEKAKAENEKLEKQKAEKAEKEAQAKLEAKSKVLGNGNFISGEDFDPGVYNIVAVKGGGNVSSSNMYSGGINAIMGSDEKIKESEAIGMKDFYKKEYKNIKLPKGTELKLDDVEVKLIPKE